MTTVVENKEDEKCSIRLSSKFFSKHGFNVKKKKEDRNQRSENQRCEGGEEKIGIRDQSNTFMSFFQGKNCPDYISDPKGVQLTCPKLLYKAPKKRTTIVDILFITHTCTLVCGVHPKRQYKSLYALTLSWAMLLG